MWVVHRTHHALAPTPPHTIHWKQGGPPQPSHCRTPTPTFTNAQTPAQKNREHNHPPNNPHNTKAGGRPQDDPPPSQKTVAATYSPTPPQGSTISAKRLNDRVRKETGCDPPAITTTETTHHPPDSTHPNQGKESQRAASSVKSVREHPIICSGQALGLLVPVSSTPHRASTPGLSTPSSIGSLTLSRRQETSSQSKLPA